MKSVNVFVGDITITYGLMIIGFAIKPYETLGTTVYVPFIPNAWDVLALAFEGMTLFGFGFGVLLSWISEKK